MNFKKVRFFFGAVSLSSLLSLGVFATSNALAQTWQEPSAAPPSGNVPAPIWNIATSSTAQTANFHISGSGSIDTTLLVAGGFLYKSADGVAWWMNNSTNGPAIMLMANAGAGGYANRRGSLGWSDNTGGKTEVLTWTDGTKVGINITNPATLLQVNTTTTRSDISLTNSNTNYGAMIYSQANATDAFAFCFGNMSDGCAGTERRIQGFGNGNPMQIGDYYGTVLWSGANTEVMRITSGNVSIGGVTSPTSRLDIGRDLTAANLNAGSSVHLELSGLTDQTKQVLLGFETENNFGFMQTLQRGTSWTTYNLALQPKGGKVGIGTYAPSQELEVATTGNTKIAVNSGDGYDSGVSILEAGNIRWILDNYGAGGNDTFSIRDKDLNRVLNILQGGYVGINSLNPQSRLEVKETSNLLDGIANVGIDSQVSGDQSSNYGMHAHGTGGIASYGLYATAMDGSNYSFGVNGYANTAGALSIGVEGDAAGSGYNNYGVWGQAKVLGTSGTTRNVGVFGEATSSNVQNIGVKASASGTDAWGFYTDNNSYVGGGLNIAGQYNSYFHSIVGSYSSGTGTSFMGLTTNVNYYNLLGAADRHAGFGVVMGSNVVSPIVWMYANSPGNAFDVRKVDYNVDPSSGTSLFTVRSSGNVGIGTTAPGNLLTLYGTSNYGIMELIGNGTNAETTIGFRSSNVGKGATGDWVVGVNGGNTPTGSFSFYQGSTVMNILPAGNVVIGGTSSSFTARALLETNGVVGNTAAIFGNGTTGVAIINSWPAVGFNMYYNGGSKSIASGFGGQVNFDPTTGNMIFDLTTASASAANQTFTTDTAMIMTPSSGIDMKKTLILRAGFTSWGDIYLSGHAYKTGTLAWETWSDSRLKTNIRPFTDGLSVIEKINPVKYQYNGKGGLTTGVNYVGVLAQDLKKVAPYMVGTGKLPSDPSGAEYLTIDPSDFQFLLINAVKEQQSQIDDLKGRIERLESKK